MKTYQVKAKYNPADFSRIVEEISDRNLIDGFFFKDIGFKWNAYEHKECYVRKRNMRRYYLWDQVERLIFSHYKLRTEFFDCLSNYPEETAFFKGLEDKFNKNIKQSTYTSDLPIDTIME